MEGGLGRLDWGDCDRTTGLGSYLIDVCRSWRGFFKLSGEMSWEMVHTTERGAEFEYGVFFRRLSPYFIHSFVIGHSP